MRLNTVSTPTPHGVSPPGLQRLGDTYQGSPSSPPQLGFRFKDQFTRAHHQLFFKTSDAAEGAWPVDIDPDSLAFLHKIDEEKKLRYTDQSFVNSMFRALHPPERGVIVYASAGVQKDPELYRLACDVGAALKHVAKDSQKTPHLVFGGVGRSGSLMEAVGRGATENGVHTVGVDVAHLDATVDGSNKLADGRTDQYVREAYITPVFPERIYGRHGFEARSGYTVALPGGAGTLMEIVTKAVELSFNKTLFPAQKQIVLLDYKNFYTAPGGFMDHMRFLEKHGMMKPGFTDIFTVVKTPREMVKALQRDDVPWTPGVSPRLVMQPLRLDA
jgi:predicted Rossmann-fold nucleotide-binding protein